MSQERGACVDDHCAFAGAKHYHGMSYPPEEWANMRAMLLKLEWAATWDGDACCAECGATKHPAAGQNREGFGLHYTGCALAVILEKLR